MTRLTSLAAIAALLVAAVSIDVDAQRRRRGRSRPRAADAAPHRDALAGDMNGIEWGWDRRQLLRHLRRQIEASYADRLREAPGAIEEDRLRHQMGTEVRRIRDSYFEFDGTVSGHDSSYIRGEFTHRNQEAMMRVRTEQSEDTYFFIRGRLWKWYRAFHSEVFDGAPFEDFSAALQGRYGRGRVRSGDIEGRGFETQWVEWQDDATRARAIDNTRFYGFYSLVFDEKATIARLDELRTPAEDRGPSHASRVIDAVTSEPGSVRDPHDDVADRLVEEHEARTRAASED